MSGLTSQLWLGVATTGLGTLLGWSGKTILAVLTGAESREAEMHKQGWALAAERDKEIVLLRGVIMRSFSREEASKSAFRSLLLILQLPVEKQAGEIRKLREMLARSISSQRGGGA